MKNTDMEALVRPNIRALCPYSTARDEYRGPVGVFLDANESPWPTGFNRYPDPHQKALKAALSEIKGVPAEQIFVGNGSDEAIDVLIRVFCTPGQDSIAAIAPSYGMYEVAAAINDIEVRKVQLGKDYALPVEELLAACDEGTKAMFLCSPNNPTGNAFSLGDIRFLLDNFGGIVVVDEAYIDFSSVPSLLGELDSHPNLVVLQTLSKAWGMAALRVGLAFASEYIIKVMSEVKYPYNINAEAQRLALEALSSPIGGRVAETKAQRALVASFLEGCGFVQKVWPSEANFILVKVTDADSLYAHLLADGIIVRNRSRVKGCEGCLRITIGTPEENLKLKQSLSDYEKGNIRR